MRRRLRGAGGSEGNGEGEGEDGTGAAAGIDEVHSARRARWRLTRSNEDDVIGKDMARDIAMVTRMEEVIWERRCQRSWR